ncbi:Sialidase [Aspergillus pseudoustus]|uniref:Sialidase n=1 Tax=Aspergillus pseudoustus TaxID=1810923 RepID=A0ABR4KW16_9EURO
MRALSYFALSTLMHLSSFLIPPAAADADGTIVWTPDVANTGGGYVRVIQLQHAGDANGKLLATWEHWYTKVDDKPTNGTASSYIIQESTDSGATWDTLATITDPQTDPDHPAPSYFYQPFFFEFPQQLGKYPAGTLLLIGNLSNGNVTDFFSWRSTNHGKTWESLGKWESGQLYTPGRIWEPFLYLDSAGKLVAMYSSQQDWHQHMQKLVQVISEDGGDTWGNATEVAVGEAQNDRPGMATVARMDNGEFLLSFEWCDENRPHDPCPVHVKTSPDGSTWDSTDPGTVLVTPDGVQATGSPYTIWDSAGKQLILSSKAHRWNSDLGLYTPLNQRIVLVNTDHGNGDWVWATSPWTVPNSTDICGANYSPDLLALPDGTTLYTTEASIDATNSKSHCEPRTGAARIAPLPFTSNFSSTGQAGWIDFGGDWSISGDTYEFSATDSATIALTGSSGWTDYEVSANVTITSDSGVVGLVARASAFRSAPNSFTRYTAAIDSNRGNVALYRVTGEGARLLHSQAHDGGIHVNTFYHLSLAVQSTNITVTLSEDGRSTTTFSSTDGGLKSGAPGLYGSYGRGGFQDVQISSLT